MKLVIVESPAKAKTINKYLGRDYKVLASYGHVRDLPSKNGSVLPDDDFKMVWSADSRGREKLSAIASAAKSADEIILATDPDREGEAISWHILEELSKKKLLKDKQVERVVFNAITKKSILEAMRNPRQLDTPLVEAYLARRAIDYLVGFSLSPVLWRKLPGARSAGRVQSVALRLVCDREEEIERFKREEYWNIVGQFAAKGGPFEARLTGYMGEKLAKLDVKTEAQATGIKAMLELAEHKVLSVEAKPVSRNPYAPFTTSTLQQEASSKLGFSASRAMQVAQRLYEGIELGGETVGLITYMRTDGVQMAPEAIAETREVIGARFGAINVPDKPRHYSSKAKNAQEAHEAVRPTSLKRHPEEMRKYLENDQARLYELIWKRTIASQMASAKLERTTAELRANYRDESATMRAVGSVVKFEGFLSVYADAKKAEAEEDRRLPPLSEGERVEAKEIAATQHSTEPPARYSEASLIKRLEELGIGRPSTYASTLQTLQDRDYVTIDKRRLMPTDKGRILIPFLQNFFSKYVEYDFTADLETQLDRISAGDLAWKDVLREFWRDLDDAIKQTDELRVAEVIDTLNEQLEGYIFPQTDEQKEEGENPRLCPRCKEGELSLKLSRNGAFIGCSNYPECGYTRAFGDRSEEALNDTKSKEGALGQHPETGLDIFLKSGRFGSYLEMGEGDAKKTGSLPPSMKPADIDYEMAVKLIDLPRFIGNHPEDGKPIHARFARYGPVVQLGEEDERKKYGNLDEDDEVFTVGINRAVAVLAQPRGRGRAAPAPPLKELGEFPELGGSVTVKDGRYGAYVNWEKVNATLPKGKVPTEVTIEEAVDLLKERAEKTGKPLKRAGAAKKAAPKKKPAAKKTAAKKPAAKKPAAKRKPAAKNPVPAE